MKEFRLRDSTTQGHPVSHTTHIHVNTYSNLHSSYTMYMYHNNDITQTLAIALEVVARDTVARDTVARDTVARDTVGK